VIYPWYLLYLTPFLFDITTVPVAAWTYSVLPVYIVWERARAGAPWSVPAPVMIFEFGVVLLAALASSRVWRDRDGN
jgi:hypothetical protein